MFILAVLLTNKTITRSGGGRSVPNLRDQGFKVELLLSWQHLGLGCDIKLWRGWQGGGHGWSAWRSHCKKTMCLLGIHRKNKKYIYSRAGYVRRHSLLFTILCSYPRDLIYLAQTLNSSIIGIRGQLITAAHKWLFRDSDHGMKSFGLQFLLFWFMQLLIKYLLNLARWDCCHPARLPRLHPHRRLPLGCLTGYLYKKIIII